MDGNKIIIVRGTDWEVLFLNGIEHSQDHDISLYDIARLTPIVEISLIDMPSAVDLHLCDTGEAPSRISYDDFMKLGT